MRLVSLAALFVLCELLALSRALAEEIVFPELNSKRQEWHVRVEQALEREEYAEARRLLVLAQLEYPELFLKEFSAEKTKINSEQENLILDRFEQLGKLTSHGSKLQGYYLRLFRRSQVELDQNEVEAETKLKSLANYTYTDFLQIRGPEFKQVVQAEDEFLGPDWAYQWGQDFYGIFARVYVGRVNILFRLIPQGSLRLEDGHVVEVQQAYWMAALPVSVALARECGIAANEQNTRLAASNLSFEEIETILASMQKLIPRAVVRIADEQEWEYAARAMVKTDYPSWVLNKTALLCERKESASLAQYNANAFGLFDVQGGIWELVVAEDGGLVYRGGSWRSIYEHCAFSMRRHVISAQGDSISGLRLLIEIEP